MSASVMKRSGSRRHRASISEITEFLAPYCDPVVAANTAASDFRIVDLMNHVRPVSLYIVVAPADQEMLTPLIRLMRRRQRSAHTWSVQQLLWNALPDLPTGRRWSGALRQLTAHAEA
jgi:hypothetical protein